MHDTTRSGPLWSMALLSAMLFVAASPLFAQEAAPNEPAAAPNAMEGNSPASLVAAAATGDESFLELVLQSGPMGIGFMLVLLLFSLVSATIAIERAVNTRREKIIPAGFEGELRQILARDKPRLDSLRRLCAANAAPIARVLDAGLLRVGRPLTEVEKCMEDAAAREMADVRGRIRPLSTVGSIAPLVGLLGTVVGMIIAFRTASQEGLGKGQLMAQGIYLALLTTAAGLVIAIPCLLLAAYYNAKVEKFFREIDERLMRTFPLLAGSAPDAAPGPPEGEAAEAEESEADVRVLAAAAK
ncbi:MAG: MotA/TolQ/ExbB proton channel family protein [Planctomycetales bacterium]